MNPISSSSSSLLTFLIIQLLAVVCCGETWRLFESDVNANEKPVFDRKGFLSGGLEGLPDAVDALAPDDVPDMSTSPDLSADLSAYGGAWKVIGSGLMRLIEMAEVSIKGACISISVAAGQTCGGLKADTCERVAALRESVKKLKEEAVSAIERNDDLLRWNATNAHLGFEMRRIADEVDDIITINAEMMDLTDTMNYDKKATAVDGSELTDESGSSLADFQFRVRMEPVAYIRKVTKYLRNADITEPAKDKIAFAVALGVSMSSQCVPDVLRGMLGLDQEIAAVADRLLVILDSADTNVTFGFQYSSRRQFFANMTSGAATSLLGAAQSKGLAGFFGLFVDGAVGKKVEDMILRDANKVRVEQGASADLLRRLQETQTLERFVDITKAMPDLDFEQILHVAANKDLKAVLKDLEVAEIPTNPHGINEKIIKKIAKGFKNFEKFFTDVKKSLDVASQRFDETGLTWNKIGYYGFNALAQLSRFSNLAICVINIISTKAGARQMREKVAEAEVQTKQALLDIKDARVKGEVLLKLQKSLHEGVNEDLRKMATFFAQPLKDMDQVPAEFTARVRRVQKYFSAFAASDSVRETSVDRAKDLTMFLFSVRGLAQGFLDSLLKERRIVQMAKYDAEIEDIKVALESIGHKKTTFYAILRHLAFSDEFAAASTYDSFPLACIRDGSIQSEGDLENWFNQRTAPLVPQATKLQIKTLVDFWSTSPDAIEPMLVKSKHFCHDRQAFARDGSLTHAHCSLDDVLAVIATDVLPDQAEYQGVDLLTHRIKYDC